MLLDDIRMTEILGGIIITEIMGGIVITKKAIGHEFFQDSIFEHREVNLFIEPWRGFPDGDSYWMILK